MKQQTQELLVLLLLLQQRKILHQTAAAAAGAADPVMLSLDAAAATARTLLQPGTLQPDQRCDRHACWQHEAACKAKQRKCIDSLDMRNTLATGQQS
jgi:hypothetical protein